MNLFGEVTVSKQDTDYAFTRLSTTVKRMIESTKFAYLQGACVFRREC